MSVIYSNLPWLPIIMTDTPALYKMSLSSLSKQLKFGGPDQCQSCSGHLCGSAFRPLKGKSGPGEGYKISKKYIGILLDHILCVY